MPVGDSFHRITSLTPRCLYGQTHEIRPLLLTEWKIKRFRVPLCRNGALQKRCFQMGMFRCVEDGRRRVYYRRDQDREESLPPITEVVIDNVKGKNKLASSALKREIRKRAEEAIAKGGCRVTVGDVAASGSLTLTEAESALKAIASDSLATLQVSDNGDVVYVFPDNFRARIRGKSLKLRAEPVLEGLGKGVAYFARVAFGTALITSIVTVSIALFFVSSSSKDDKNERDDGVILSVGRGSRIWFDLTDILWYWDPFYDSRRASIRAAGGPDPGMSFVEAVFSFVFGDGDPNEGYEKLRWRQLGRYIQSRGGVVTAEEMAPFLDVTPAEIEEEQRFGRVANESFVLPALTRLQGTPEVDSKGNIVYRFPQLQTTATTSRSPAVAQGAFESRWRMTGASKGQLFAVIALGLFNLYGVFQLSSMLASPSSGFALVRNGLGWVIRAMPYLQAYAISFFVIPAVRYLFNAARNMAIEERNKARHMALQVLRNPSSDLALKLDAASKQAQQRFVSEKDIVYRTDRGIDEQPEDIEIRIWDQKLEQRSRDGDFKG